MTTITDAREALDTATKAVTAAHTNAQMRQALIALLDALALIAAVVGVPDAIEPDTKELE